MFSIFIFCDKVLLGNADMELLLFSVIISIYKIEKYLDWRIKSLVEQTYSNQEIILVDDGSPDACPEKCDKQSRQDKRIKVIHKQNDRLYDAINACLEIEKANIVCLLTVMIGYRLSM